MGEMMYEDEIPVGRAKDLRGQKFGRLIVLYRVKSKGRWVRWKCKCDCGNICEVNGDNLKSGRTQSCGCYQKEVTSERFSLNLIGQRFGKLIVIEKTDKRGCSGSIIWKCKCDCGNICEVGGDNLKKGNTQSCGCYWKEIISNNLIGQRFGRLTVIEKTDKRSGRGHIVWKCKCDCGNICEVNGNLLMRGNTQSCGCLLSKGEEKISSILRENNISFIQQKSFDTCRFKDTNSLARFDFYIDDKYLIEYDGIQHFEFTDSGWDTEEKFKITQDHDEYKNQWCRENGIPLIRIPYTQLDKLKIEDLLIETSKFIIK